MRGKPVGPEAPRRGRLKDDLWIRRLDQPDDGFAPAAVVRKFEHIALEIDFAARMHRGKPRSRLRLDVPRQQQSRGLRVLSRAFPSIDLDCDHERHVVVAP